MTRARRFGRNARTGVLLVLAAAAGGCAPALDAGLGLVGIERTRDTNPFTSARPQKTVVASTYETAPSIAYWSEMARSSVSTLPMRLFQPGAAGPFGCATSGVSRVLPVFETPGTTVFQGLGPVEIAATGHVLGSLDLLTGRTDRYVANSLGTTARLGTHGPHCGYSFFMYVRPKGLKTDPVSVLR